MTTSKNKSDNNWDTFFSYCYKVAFGVLHNSTQTKDVAQEALTSAFPQIQNGEVENPKAYLRKITERLCFKLLKEPVGVSFNTSKKTGDDQSDSEIPSWDIDLKTREKIKKADTFWLPPGIELETVSSAFETLKREDLQKAQGIFRSIELADELFSLKARIRQRKSEAAYLFDTRQVIDAACRRLRLPAKRTDELRRYLALQDKGPFERTSEEEAELNKLNEDGFKLGLLQKLCDLRSFIEGPIYTDPVFNPFIWTYGNFEDFIAVSRLKIAPVKILVKVWHRALKRGRKYGDLKLIKMLALEFKERTRDTSQAYLFSGLTDKNFNTLRKRSLYSRNKGFNKLAKRIYELSFLAGDENQCKKIDGIIDGIERKDLGKDGRTSDDLTA